MQLIEQVQKAAGKLFRAHRILWIRECVTSYTANTTGEIQTWCPVLL